VNCSNAHLFLPLVAALSERKTIQVFNICSGTKGKWEDIEDPSFTEHPSKYRVKPEPKDCWLLITEHSQYIFYATKLAAECSALNMGGTVHHMREVLP
jgi:hypothetical protein